METEVAGEMFKGVEVCQSGHSLILRKGERCRENIKACPKGTVHTATKGMSIGETVDDLLCVSQFTVRVRRASCQSVGIDGAGDHWCGVTFSRMLLEIIGSKNIADDTMDFIILVKGDAT